MQRSRIHERQQRTAVGRVHRGAHWLAPDRAHWLGHPSGVHRRRHRRLLEQRWHDPRLGRRHGHAEGRVRGRQVLLHQEQRWRRADGGRVRGDQEGQPGARAPDARVDTQRAHCGEQPRRRLLPRTGGGDHARVRRRPHRRGLPERGGAASAGAVVGGGGGVFVHGTVGRCIDGQNMRCWESRTGGCWLC